LGENKCPKCGSGEEELDWRIDDKGFIIWNCFECEHTWKVKLGK